MTSNIWVRRVTATRSDGTSSVIELKPGLNCIVGPSNAGKTRVAKTIAYACGENDIPFTAETGYVSASVTFTSDKGDVTLTRSLNRPRRVSINSSNPHIASGDYSVSRKGKNPINDALLSLINIEASRKVVTNESYRTVSFTWNSIRHLMLVPENQIVRPEPSILLPRSSSGTTITQNLSTLLVLTQDEDFTGVVSQETESERRARKKPLHVSFINNSMPFSHESKKLEQIERKAIEDGTTFEAYAQQLHDTIETLNLRRRYIISQDSQVVEQISELNQELEQISVRITQGETLISQYDADLARLDLQLQVLRHNREHPYPDTCQFCHSTIQMKPPSDEDITAREAEAKRIHMLRTDASKHLNALQNSKKDLQHRLDKAQQSHLSLMDELKHEIQPEVKTTQERLDNLAAAARISAEQTELLAMRNHYLAALDEKDQDHPDFEKYKPRNWFHEDFYYSIRSKLQDILYLIHMPNAGKADFDRQTFDITIDGYSKAAEQGKGYCALLNTVLLLAFHDYLNRRSSHALQWLLIDTPLLGFDEGVHAISTSMRAGLFDALKEQARDQQIIILENTDHIDELDFDSNVNLIRFTKNRHQGRYGYLNDVYDITETTPLR